MVECTDAETLQGFVVEHTDAFATVYTDESTSYASLPFEHGSVKHSASEYVRGDVHTNGIESFWSMLKRRRREPSTVQPKAPARYVNEFAGRHNIRDKDTLSQEGTSRWA